MSQNKFKFGLSNYSLSIDKVYVIKETPKKVKVLLINKFSKDYEKFLNKDFFNKNYFNTLQEAKNHLVKNIEERKVLAKKNYEERLLILEKRLTNLKNLKEEDFIRK